MHPWLADKVLRGRCFDCDSRLPIPVARRGPIEHGTVVSCVVASLQIGVAPLSRIVPVRYTGTDPCIQAKAIAWAAANADIVLCPWSSVDVLRSTVIDHEITTAATVGRRSLGTVVVAPVTTDGLEASYPASNAHTVSVGLELPVTSSEATGKPSADALLPSTYFEHIPSVPIFTRQNSVARRTASRTVRPNGSSCAAALVAGLIARWLTEESSLTAASVRRRLSDGVDVSKLLKCPQVQSESFSV